MTDYIKLDASEVTRQIDALIAAYPELAEDESLRADMVEGETGLDQVISRALDHMAEADMMVNAISERCSQQQERQKRYERRSDAMRGLIKDLMIHANLKGIPLPEATLTLSKGRETVNITNLADLPQGFFVVSHTADRRAIGAALKAGEIIPGAELKTSEIGLVVRRK